MAIKVEVGQVWVNQIGWPDILFEVERLEHITLHAPHRFAVYVKLSDKKNQSVSVSGFHFGETDVNCENSEWNNGWSLVAKEKPCKNKSCRNMNDVGAKICFWCECSNPTDY